MFKRINRLVKKKDIDNVYQHGRTSQNQFCAVKAHKNLSGQPRFCIVVSKKNSLLATERNKIKRRIRESIKNNIEALAPDFDYLIIIKKPFLSLDRNEQKTKVWENFIRLKLTSHDRKQ